MTERERERERESESENVCVCVCVCVYLLNCILFVPKSEQHLTKSTFWDVLICKTGIKMK